MQTTRPPASHEFAPFYKGYVERVPPGDIVVSLRAQLAVCSAALRATSDARRSYRYAPDKWSVGDVWAHVVDTERLFSYRAMHIARGLGTAALPGVDQDTMAANARAAQRTMASLRVEFEGLRVANLEMCSVFGDVELDRSGTASGHHVTVRALLYMLYGHVAHHLEVLRERYAE